MNDPYKQLPRAPLAGVPLGSGKKSGKKAKKVKSGESRVFRVLAVLFAAVAVLTLFTLNLGSSATYVHVIIADENIPRGISVANSNYRAVEMDKRYLEADTFSAASAEEAVRMLDSMSGMLYSHPVYKGQQIRSTMLTETENLEPNERLVAIRAQAVRAVAATVKSGDKVDIYVSRNDGLTILLGQGVEVVAVTLESSQLDSIAAEQLGNPDLKLADYISANPIGGTYILRVPVSDVAKYIASDIGGVLTLSTRSPSGTYTSPVSVDLYGILCPDATTPQCERTR